MMKRKLLLLFALLSGILTYSQPSLSLRAYKQVVFPGTVPAGISENNAPTASIGKKASTNYYLYLIYPKKETVLPQQLWINKKAYTLKVEPVPQTPVNHTVRNIPTRPVTTQLVPKTTGKVVRLVPAAATNSMPTTTSIRKLVDTSELVVSYKWKGKTYYKALKQITELEPEMME